MSSSPLNVPPPDAAAPAGLPSQPRLPAPLPSAPRPARKRPVWLIVLLVALSVLVGLGAFVGLGLVVLANAKPLPVTEADRAMLLSIEDVADVFEDLEVPPGEATVTKTRHLDGSYALESVYSPEGAPLYLSTQVHVERKVSDALTTYGSLSMGASLGMSFSGNKGVALEERDDLFRWGDNSRTALITNNGAPVGVLFATRKGKRVFMVVLVGVDASSEGVLEALIGSRLERLEGYDPRG